MIKNGRKSAGWKDEVIRAVTLVLSTGILVVVFTEPLGRIILRKRYLYDHGRGETEITGSIAVAILTAVGLAIGIALNQWRDLRRNR